MTEIHKRKLTSSSLIHAPSIIQWARNGAKFESERATMIKVICTCWKISEAEATYLLDAPIEELEINDTEGSVTYRYNGGE